MLISGASACGGDDEKNDDGGDSGQTFAGTAAVTVAYTGGGTGTLIISIGTVETPVCPTDVPTAYNSIPVPVFPVSYTFENMPAGSYYAFGFLDINADAPFPPCPQTDDWCGRTLPATTIDAAHPSATFNVTLDIAGCQYP
jgi:hypothetical protein